MVGEVKKLREWSKHDMLMDGERLLLRVEPCSHGVVLVYLREREVSSVLAQGMVPIRGITKDGKIEEIVATKHIARRWYDCFFSFDWRVKYGLWSLRRHVERLAFGVADAKRIRSALEV